MSEFNFDKMQNLDIPDEWAENTIKAVSKLKDTSKKRMTYSRYVLSFASVVLVVVISVVVFMMTGKMSSVPPVYLKDEAADAITQTEISTTKQEIVETETPTKDCTEDIDSQKYCTEYIEETYPDDYVDPDLSGGSTSGSDNSSSSSSMYPNNTDNIKYLVAPDCDPDKLPEEKYLYTSFLPYPYVGPATGDEVFYCKILNKGEKFSFEDPDFYDESRKVGVYETNEKLITIRFCAGKNGGVTKNGDYDFYVYDTDGVIQSIDRVRITWFDE